MVKNVDIWYISTNYNSIINKDQIYMFLPIVTGSTLFYESKKCGRFV